MKRDLDFVREILIKAEEISGEGTKFVNTEMFSTYSEKKIGYHLQIFIEAGLIDAGLTKVGAGWFIPDYIERLTWLEMNS